MCRSLPIHTSKFPRSKRLLSGVQTTQGKRIVLSFIIGSSLLTFFFLLLLSGRVEGALYQDSTIAALLQLFAAANTQTSLTPMLHAFNRLLSASSKLNHALVSKGLVSKLLEKLRITQLPAETRIDLLKFLKMLFESAAAKKEFVSRHALTAALEPLSKDKAVLVQELASQLTAQFGKL